MLVWLPETLPLSSPYCAFFDLHCLSPYNVQDFQN